MMNLNSKRVLILEDDLRLAESLGCEFRDHGYDVTLAQKRSEIPALSFDFAVLDLRLNGEYGLDAVELIKELSSDCRILVLSGYGSITTAVEAVKRGAVDYLTKPASFRQIEDALLGQRTQAEPSFKPPSLAQIEHEYIDFVLAKNEGNISRAARDLGLHRQSLQRKLKKYT